ncbi:C3a anaphylatoxin chemotactic receptor-like [Embiotoca jacksoni]|uniref:C3a anaphylatoxin chemotactic receptor-like n=1 Tax=Embiotoca jacksoni TaxID=100190 RepID=UPI003703771E
MGTDNINSTVSQSTRLEVVQNVQKASIAIYCLIFIVGTLGNGLVIYVTGFKMKRTVNSVWFLNLALADFLFTAFLIFSIISVFHGNLWPFGQLMCKLNTFVGVVNMFASIFLLTAISLDRCMSIWVVVWAQNKRTVLKAQIACAVIWLTAGVCSVPYATSRTLLQRNGTSRCVYPSNMTAEHKWSLYTVRFVVGFLVPFLVIFISYVAIGVRVGRLHRTRKPRSRRILFSIIFAFFICWLPFHVFSFIELEAGKNKDLRYIIGIGGPLALSLAFMNSCLNPILYVFICDEFQKKLQTSICFVLESALAEDHLSFLSFRSLSSHFSRVKSDSGAPLEDKFTPTSLTFTESKEGITDNTLSPE